MAVSCPAWEAEALPAIQTEDVKEALKKFKWRTGIGLCNWNPKDWDKLSDKGIETLAMLLNKIEETHCWPSTLLHTAMVRPPKQDSGHRLIGLLSTLYRV